MGLVGREYKAKLGGGGGELEGRGGGRTRRKAQLAPSTYAGKQSWRMTRDLDRVKRGLTEPSFPRECVPPFL